MKQKAKERMHPGIIKNLSDGLLHSVRILEDCSEKLSAGPDQDNRVMGIKMAATVIAAHLSELLLKCAFEQHNPGKTAPNSHDLYDLYDRLPASTKGAIEKIYSWLPRPEKPPPYNYRDTVRGTFWEDADASMEWRYLPEYESNRALSTNPTYLANAAQCVLETLDWSQKDNADSSNEIKELESLCRKVAECTVHEKHQDAVHLLDKVIRLNPDDPWDHYTRGKCKVQLQQRDQARKDFQNALRLAKRVSHRLMQRKSERQIRDIDKGHSQIPRR